jgi:hypothetical protein
MRFLRHSSAGMLAWVTARAFSRMLAGSSSSTRPPRYSNNSSTTLRSLTSGQPRTITSSFVSNDAMMHLVTWLEEPATATRPPLRRRPPRISMTLSFTLLVVSRLLPRDQRDLQTRREDRGRPRFFGKGTENSGAGRDPRRKRAGQHQPPSPRGAGNAEPGRQGAPTGALRRSRPRASRANASPGVAGLSERGVDSRT